MYLHTDFFLYNHNIFRAAWDLWMGFEGLIFSSENLKFQMKPLIVIEPNISENHWGSEILRVPLCVSH